MKKEYKKAHIPGQIYGHLRLLALRINTIISISS